MNHPLYIIGEFTVPVEAQDLREGDLVVIHSVGNFEPGVLYAVCVVRFGELMRLTDGVSRVIDLTGTRWAYRKVQ